MGTNAATVKDIVDLRKSVHTKTTLGSNQMARIEDRLKRLDRNINATFNTDALTPTPRSSVRSDGDTGGSAHHSERRHSSVPASHRCITPRRSQVGGRPDDAWRAAMAALDECVSTAYRQLQALRMQNATTEDVKQESRFDQVPYVIATVYLQWMRKLSTKKRGLPFLHGRRIR